MNLFEIDAEILSCVDMETGEIIDAEKLDALNMEKSKKIRNIACWIKELNAESAALKEQKDVFAAREKAAKNKAEGLKNYLAAYLDGKPVKAAEYQIGFRKSTATEITDEAAIPAEYRIPQPDKIDRSGILAALKNGAVIAGAELVERQSIQIK
ncbi:siphovirus Gp157 family protein [Selenomonas sp. TAMA-11512]|uniref:siphovirus Gp157 family protein n=1 Tax=Selenomonas sp. TAMA-11512 TaxID=3095337 RepID=UPI0030CBA96D